MCHEADNARAMRSNNEHLSTGFGLPGLHQDETTHWNHMWTSTTTKAQSAGAIGFMFSVCDSGSYKEFHLEIELHCKVSKQCEEETEKTENRKPQT